MSESSLINHLRGPPRAFFLLPPRFARIASRASDRRSCREPYSFPCLHSFNCVRSAASSFLECIMAQIQKICKNNVEKPPKRPEFRTFGDAAAGSAVRRRQLRTRVACERRRRTRPTCAATRLWNARRNNRPRPEAPLAQARGLERRGRSMRRLTRRFQPPAAGTFVSSGSAAQPVADSGRSPWCAPHRKVLGLGSTLNRRMGHYRRSKFLGPCALPKRRRRLYRGFTAGGRPCAAEAD